MENDLLKKIEEGKNCVLINNIKPIFDFILNKSANSIAYDDNVNKYFNTSNFEYGFELGNVLKPYCKIIKYEIIKVNNQCVVAKLTKYNKKGNTEHEVTWEYEYDEWTRQYRIKASSIDAKERKGKSILDLIL